MAAFLWSIFLLLNHFFCDIFIVEVNILYDVLFGQVRASPESCLEDVVKI